MYGLLPVSHNPVLHCPDLLNMCGAYCQAVIVWGWEQDMKLAGACLTRSITSWPLIRLTTQTRQTLVT